VTPSTPSPPNGVAAARFPHVFVDRSLGAIQVPALLRAAGIVLTTMREPYGEIRAQAVTDHEWIALTAQRGWIAFHKDDSIRMRLSVSGRYRCPHVLRPARRPNGKRPGGTIHR